MSEENQVQEVAQEAAVEPQQTEVPTPEVDIPEKPSENQWATFREKEKELRKHEKALLDQQAYFRQVLEENDRLKQEHERWKTEPPEEAIDTYIKRLNETAEQKQLRELRQELEDLKRFRQEQAEQQRRQQEEKQRQAEQEQAEKASAEIKRMISGDSKKFAALNSLEFETGELEKEIWQEAERLWQATDEEDAWKILNQATEQVEKRYSRLIRKSGGVSSPEQGKEQSAKRPSLSNGLSQELPDLRPSEDLTSDERVERARALLRRGLGQN